MSIFRKMILLTMRSSERRSVRRKSDRRAHINPLSDDSDQTTREPESGSRCTQSGQMTGSCFTSTHAVVRWHRLEAVQGTSHWKSRAGCGDGPATWRQQALNWEADFCYRILRDFRLVCADPAGNRKFLLLSACPQIPAEDCHPGGSLM